MAPGARWHRPSFARQSLQFSGAPSLSWYCPEGQISCLDCDLDLNFGVEGGVRRVEVGLVSGLHYGGLTILIVENNHEKQSTNSRI